MTENYTPVLGERNFQVSYQQINHNLWRATAELTDDLHQINTWLDIKVPELVIQDAGVEFTKSPFAECNMVSAATKKLIGVKVQNLGFKLYRLFLGAKGCPNLYLLFSLSGPAFDSIYNLNLVARKEKTEQEYNLLMKKDCVAHRAIYKNME
jgi:hypothetical protein